MNRRWLPRAAALALALVVLVAAALVPVARAQQTEEDLWDTLETVLDVVQAYYKDEVDLSTLLQGAIRGALETLNDPHTAYMDAEEYGQFIESLSGSVTGIGAFIEKRDRYIIVISPIRGSPAQAAGLRPGDRILAANGTSLLDVPVERAASLIRGPAGTEVMLQVERPSEQRVFEVTIVRAVVEIPTLEYEMLPDEIGYIWLQQFDDRAVGKFRQALNDVRQQGARGVIFDLRGNSGGYLHVALQIAGVFLPEGEVVIHTLRRGEVDETLVAPGGTVDLPWVVLVDGSSASASELLAGALQDHGVAVLVGETTFGKGTVQQLFNLGSAGGLKVTWAEYVRPTMESVDGIGVTPDYVVSQPAPIVAAPLAFTRLLGPSMVGLDVLDVQERLQLLAYYQQEPNGWYNTALQAALRRFQRDQGLIETGRVDRRTVDALNNAIEVLNAQVTEEDRQLQKAIELMQILLAEQVAD